MEALQPDRTLSAMTLARQPELREEADHSNIRQQIERHARRVEIEGEGVYYLLEGDLLLDADEVDIYALQAEARRRSAEVGVGPPASADGSNQLVVQAPGGRPVRWRPGLTLTYCVLRRSFPDQDSYDVVVDCVTRAAAAWQDTCGVEFDHLPQHDDHQNVTAMPTDIAADLVFTVRHIDAQGEFIAAAFFPTYPPVRRRVLIDPSFFDPTLGFDQVGVLRHELGHTLGFRHEHIRDEAPPTCPDESLADIFPLTEFDPKSVMHYFCGGAGSRALEITELDRVGSQKVYGPPFASLHLVE